MTTSSPPIPPVAASDLSPSTEAPPGAARWGGSSIGAKAIMAVTGLLLLLFVIVHLLGNLQIFLGPEALNAYARVLKSLPELLWLLRAGLLVVFVVHIVAAVQVTLQNRRARPIRYRVLRANRVGLSSRTLIWTGAAVLAFVIYHLLHFTIGVTDPESFHRVDALGRHDVYAMVILGFSRPAVALSYAGAMLLLGLHLRHAIPSLFQTLGLSSPGYRPLWERAGAVLAALIVAGNVLLPLAVLAGLVGPGRSLGP